MDSTHRLHIASRIHLALLRELGSGIDVGLMLSRELYALDVINVCRASDNEELERLAEQFAQASPAAALTQPVPPFPAQPARPAWWRTLGGALPSAPSPHADHAQGAFRRSSSAPSAT